MQLFLNKYFLKIAKFSLLAILISPNYTLATEQDRSTNNTTSQTPQIPAGLSQRLRNIYQTALAGDAAAQYLLGMAYSNGEEVPEDFVQAKSWFEKSTRQGNQEAKYQLYLLNTIPKNWKWNGRWDKDCEKCWPKSQESTQNTCTPKDCILQGFYQCEDQTPALKRSNDPRLLELIKSGHCTLQK